MKRVLFTHFELTSRVPSAQPHHDIVQFPTQFPRAWAAVVPEPENPEPEPEVVLYLRDATDVGLCGLAGAERRQLVSIRYVRTMAQPMAACCRTSDGRAQRSASRGPLDGTARAGLVMWVMPSSRGR